MLDGLDDIPWATVADANGTSAHVPGLVRLLLKPDVVDWSPALEELWNSVDQGVVYDATVRALPFLIELAAKRSICCRHRLLKLLGHIAAASVYWSRESKTPWPMADDERRVYRDLLAASWHAIGDACHTAVDSLSDADARVRLAAAYFIGQAADVISRAGLAATQASGAALCQRLWFDASPLVRGSAALALGELSPFWPDAIMALDNLSMADTPAVRLCAALALVGSTPVPPSWCMQTLEAAVRDPDGTNWAFHDSDSTAQDEWDASSLGQAYAATGFDAPRTLCIDFPWFTGGPVEHCTTVLSAARRAE